MALINQNSIIGLTSITSPSASNVLTLHTNDTTERLRVSTSGLSFSGTNASLDTSGNLTVGGNVSIGGTLTYEDVTNIDSVGVVTARSGIHVTGGSVGIGTDNPSALLHLSSSAPIIKLQDNNNTGVSALQRIDAVPSTGGTQWFVGQNSTTTNDLYLYNVANANLLFGTNNTEKLRITSDGNIGIGTDNPPAKLSVDGSVIFGNTTSSGSGGTLRIVESGNSVYIQPGSNTSNDSSCDLIISSINGATERLRITSDGVLSFKNSSPPAWSTDSGYANATFGSSGYLRTDTDVNSNFLIIGSNAYRDSSGWKHTNAGWATQLQQSANDGDLTYSTSTTSGSAGGTVSWSEKLRITSDGNFGFGDSGPTNFTGYTNLSIHGSTGGAITFGDDGTDEWEIYGGDGVLKIYDRANTSERLRITSAGKLGVGEDTPASQVDIKGNVASTTQFSGFDGLRIHNANGAQHGISADMYFTVGTGTANRGAAIGVEYSSAASGNDLYFATNPNAVTSNDTLVERLRITSDGTIRKGNSNGDNGKQPVELFFQKRGTQIGKRIHQGSGGSSTTHNILNIDSWQSTNSHLFAYVTVYYVSPVANYGGRMECYATAVYSGGNVSGGQGTFATSDGGRWGNPGVPSLSWSGSTLRFTTLAHAYIDYSIDITYIAYDGAVVSFYGN